MMREVVAAKPDNARAHYVYAEILAHGGKLDQAVEAARTARTIDPDVKFTDPEKFRTFEASLLRAQNAAARTPPTPAPVDTRAAPQAAPARVAPDAGVDRHAGLGVARRAGRDRLRPLAHVLAPPRRAGGRRRHGSGPRVRHADAIRRPGSALRRRHAKCTGCPLRTRLCAAGGRAAACSASASAPPAASLPGCSPSACSTRVAKPTPITGPGRPACSTRREAAAGGRPRQPADRFRHRRQRLGLRIE